MNGRQLPNLITLLRVFLAVPIAGFLYQGAYWLALVLLAIAALSDGLDGYLARRYHWTTAVGAWLDAGADKILMVAIYLAVTLNGMLPLWLLFLVVGRDLWLALGWLAYRRWVRAVPVEPLMLSKINTVLQILLVLGAILEVGILGLEPGWILQGLLGIVVFTTVTSGLAYTAIWGRRTWVHFTAAPGSRDAT
jgi:cardiolipin synthase (CMP-forming)